MLRKIQRHNLLNIYLLKCSLIDYLLYTLLNLHLLNLLRGEMSIEDVDGITYRQDGKIIRNKTRELLKDLDLIPSP